MNVKNKTIGMLLTVMVIFSMLLGGLIYINQKKKLHDTQIAYYESIRKSYEKILAKHDEFYYSRAMANLQSSGIKEALLERNRVKLYELSFGRWEALKKGNPNLTVMHFHSPDGTSLLRMHDPQRFGDAIAKERLMVAHVHATKTSTHGFEVGYADLAYRTIVPAFYRGHYIGALEFGARPDDIFGEMEYFNEIHGALFIKQNPLISDTNEDNAIQIGEYTVQFATIADYGVLEALKKAEYSFPSFQTFSYRGKTYNVYSFDMRDFRGKTSAKAVFFQDISALEHDFHATLIHLLIVMFLLVTAIIFVIHVGFDKIMGELHRTTEELKKNKDFLQSIFETSKDGIALLDFQTNFLYFNNAYLEMTGFNRDELLMKSCVGLSAPEDLSRAIGVVERAIRDGFVENFEKTCIVKDGKRVIINMSLALMPDKERLLITTKNVTEAKKIEKQLKNYIRLVDENIITSSTDLDGNIISVSEAFCRISGYERSELIGHNHRIVHHPDMDNGLFDDLWSTILQGNVWSGELKNRTKTGGAYWVSAKIYPTYDENGVKTGYTAIRQDITNKKRIEEISVTDGLTGIYNRRHFNDVFPKMINGAKRKDSILCLILLDVDFFKQYNDTYGHQMGDNVLIQIAQTIHSYLGRSDDYVFRLGGEEFGIIYKVGDVEQAIQLAEQIRQSIESLRIEHKNSDVSDYVTVSMGLVCTHASKIESDDAMYKQADDLLYEAKNQGRNRVIRIECL